MARLTWDGVGDKAYEMGVDHAVLYLQEKGRYPKGVAWNGITSVTCSPSGADENAFYADNIKYGSLRGAEEFGATVECYTFPDEWELCDGHTEPIKGVTLGQQKRRAFGLCYRSLIGDDTEDAIDVDNGYKLHLIYNATASPSERQYQTLNDSPEAVTFSYELTTTPVPVTVVPNTRPVSHICVNSKGVDPDVMKNLEDILYGTDDDDSVAHLPMPDDVLRTLGYTAA